MLYPPPHPKFGFFYILRNVFVLYCLVQKKKKNENYRLKNITKISIYCVQCNREINKYIYRETVSRGQKLLEPKLINRIKEPNIRHKNIFEKNDKPQHVGFSFSILSLCCGISHSVLKRYVYRITPFFFKVLFSFACINVINVGPVRDTDSTKKKQSIIGSCDYIAQLSSRCN